MRHLHELATPALLVDETRLTANLLSMQRSCDEAGIELRPHIKTHKLVPIARRQLAAGARGLTCAKLGEAEVMLASGVRQIFLAHSLVDLRQASRIADLADQLEELRLAVTSEAHLDALLPLLRKVDRALPLMLAVDTGLHREGVRDVRSAQRIAARLASCPFGRLRGFYTHEGHLYGRPASERTAAVRLMLDQLVEVRDAIDPSLAIWPGCSVTARELAASAHGQVQAVRPGAYVFGDLSLTMTTGVMPFDHVALHVLATVVDKPEADLALIDAGSKTFSSDRTPQGVSALVADGRDLAVTAVNEEHGYVRGADVSTLRIGERLALVPAHVCPVINLASEVFVRRGDDDLLETWAIDARGKTQ